MLLSEKLEQMYPNQAVPEGAVLSKFYGTPTVGKISNIDDMITVIDEIKKTLNIDENGENTYRTHQIIAGDQESYEMMHRMKREYPARYKWLLPWPGDLHVSLNFAKCLLNHNNFKLMLEHLGIKYQLQEGQIRGLEKGSPFELTKKFLISVFLAGIADLREQHAISTGLSPGARRINSLSGLREWAAEKGKNDALFRKASDFVLRDLFAFVAHHVGVRTANFELRTQALKLMLPLFATHRHSKYVKLLSQHIIDMETMPLTQLDWAKRCFSAHRSQKPFAAQGLDELHETLVNLDLKGAMKRVDADSSWMVTLCRYLAIGVQLSVLMLEQALYRKPAALEAG